MCVHVGSDCRDLVQGRERLECSGHPWDSRSGHGATRGDLVAHAGDGFDAGSDEGNACFLQRLSKRGVFGSQNLNVDSDVRLRS